MLDYYGSIILNKKDIDKELIHSFKKKCHESYIKSIINSLRYEETLHDEYSVSGWNMFFRSNIHDIINNPKSPIFNILDQKKIKKEVDLHFSNKANKRLLIWSLISTNEILKSI